jgi:hypothetical protein
MQANPSSRWKTEIAEEIVPNHDFGLVDVYDAGPSFRQDDHQCDFCGTHLRYTAEIAAKDDRNVEFKVGIDCLEHVMGTSWSHLQDVERQIKELKEEAKRKRRKKAFAEEYQTEIEWLERYLEITENSFLSDMHEILTTGKRKFSRKMEQAVHDNMKTVNLEEIEEKEEWIGSVIKRLEELLEMIEEANVNDGAWRFVNSVRSFAENNRRVTDNQLKAVNDIYDRYEEHLSESDSEEKEEEEEEIEVPF